MIRLATPDGEAVFIDTGELPPEGGALEASLLDVEAAGFLTADVAHATTVGGKGVVRSEASLAGLRITIDEHELSADFLMSRADARCVDGEPRVDGRFEIANLVVDGEIITVNARPNQRIDLVDPSGAVVGRVTLAETVSNREENFGESTVNAMRVEVFDVAEFTLFHAHADVTCAMSEPGADALTGGGRVDGATTGAVAAFGVAGGFIDGVFWGHLNYVDREADLHLRGTSVTAYEIIDASTRRIEGTAEVNGQAGFTYVIEASDRGEPGTSDTFRIELSDGYSAGGQLITGNIQLHDLDE